VSSTWRTFHPEKGGSCARTKAPTNAHSSTDASLHLLAPECCRLRHVARRPGAGLEEAAQFAGDRGQGMVSAE